MGSFTTFTTFTHFAFMKEVKILILFCRGAGSKKRALLPDDLKCERRISTEKRFAIILP
jgi:hypothetical protein